MSETPTGTDRVELTEAERAQIIEAIYQGRIRGCRETVENWGPPEDEADTHSLLLRVLRGESEVFVANALPVVESIVAARVQALTAERDEQRAIITQLRGNLHACPKQQKAEAERDAARVELAALVTALGFDTRDPMIGRTHAERATEMVKRYDDLAAELAAANARCAELEVKVEGYSYWSMVQKNAALQATLDRVTALAGKWQDMYGPTAAEPWFITQLSAALTPEGKHVNCNCDDCDEERSLDPTPKGRP